MVRARSPLVSNAAADRAGEIVRSYVRGERTVEEVVAAADTVLQGSTLLHVPSGVKTADLGRGQGSPRVSLRPAPRLGEVRRRR